MDFYFILNVLGLIYIAEIFAMFFIYRKKNETYKTKKEKVRATYRNFIISLAVGIPSSIVIQLIIMLKDKM